MSLLTSVFFLFHCFTLEMEYIVDIKVTFSFALYDIAVTSTNSRLIFFTVLTLLMCCPSSSFQQVAHMKINCTFLHLCSYTL